jgi:hypothetical protein
VTHLPDCAVGNAKPCPSPVSLQGEAVGEHWWSGWPGAWCMKCGAPDPHEECLTDCPCPCHLDEYPRSDDGGGA